MAASEVQSPKKEIRGACYDKYTSGEMNMEHEVGQLHED